VHITEAFPARGAIEALADLVPTPDDVDAIVSFRSTNVGAEMIGRAGSRLKLIANFAVGVDNIDLAAAAEADVWVTNTPDVSTEDVAQHTVGLMLSVMRNIGRGDRMIRRGDRDAFAQGGLIGRSLNGATVGIVGRGGRISSAVERLLEPFGATVLTAGRGELEELVGRVDVLSLHCPLNEMSRHLVDYDVLANLGRGAFLINVARGAIVDERGLIRALSDGLIAGAALDVFEFEPSISSILRSLENVVFTPHLGAATVESRATKAALVCEALASVLIRGERPANLVRV
jgi:glyoxylate reductase